MVFALDLVPVQLVHKGGDVRFWSVTPWNEGVGFDRQLLFGGNNIPLADLGNHCFDCLVFVPYVVLLEFLNILRIAGRNDRFDRH